ncbi:WD40 repeat-like-containing domain [Cordyceps javanica]|nr:WD40 repeat-like-containing domain [Cordyceps javanica]
MAPEIPGYYFDPVKKKYFKIEHAHTAPPEAAWSADAVKRRRVERSVAESDRQRAKVLRRHITVAGFGASQGRHGRAADPGPALLRRELLGGGGGGGGGARGMMMKPSRSWEGGGDDDDDTQAAAWARGLVSKGSVPFAPSFARSRHANMPCLYVGGDDVKTGLGVAYATLDEETLVGSYIATDDNDARAGFSIAYSRTAPDSTGRRQGLRAEMIRCPQMSSIRYHRPSHKVLLTSREPDHSCGLYFFSPLLSEPDDELRPQWLLGETSHYQRLYIRHRLRDQWLVHQSTPAPASSPDLLCVIGTNAGLLRVNANETMSWIAPTPASASAPSFSSSAPRPSKHVPQEVFDQDFQAGGSPHVLLAGGRRPRLWLTDLRCPAPSWRSVPHDSSITHLRSVAEHQVLVAGLRSSMAVYDVRFFGREKRPGGSGSGSGRGNGSAPVLRFEGYKNEAHVHTGWDVSVELGLVAAAHDDGTVKLFSLKSGRCLTGRGSSRRGGGTGGGGDGLGGVKTDTPVRALMFQTMPRERLPSLFVGEGPLLKKFSLGVRELGDEA